MNFQNKSKEELISELKELQQANNALKVSVEAESIAQKHIMKALQASEERFQLLFNKAPLGYQSLDFDGNFIEVNQQWLDTLGYKYEEVIGKWFGDFLTPVFKDGFRKRFPIFKELGKIHSEFEMIHKNGSVLFIAFDGRIGYDVKGNFKQTHCILKDITETKHAEKALIESEEKYRLLHENAGIGIGYYKVDGTIISYNNLAARNMNGVPEDFNGKSIYDFFPKSVAEFYHERIKKAVVSEIPVVYEDEVDLPTGNKYFLSTYTRIININGEIEGIQVLSHDITDRRQAEIALKESEENLSITLNSIGDGVISTDKNGLIIQMNPVAEALCGWQLAEALGKPLSEVFTIINVETRQTVADPVKKVFEKGEIVGLANHTILVSKNGTEYQISDSAAPIKNKAGLITGVVLVFSDITESYNAQKQIKDSEEKFSKSFFNSPDSIIINRLDDGKIVSVNNGFRKIMGYEDAEVIGKTTTELNLYKNPEERNAIVNALKTTGQALDIECWFITKHGEEVLGLLSAAIIDIDGAKHIISTSRDITDRKRIELLLQEKTEEIEAQNEEYKQINDELNKTNQELAAAKDKTEESEEKYRLLYESMNQGLALHEIITDENGNPVDYVFLDINASYTRLLGVTREMSIGKRIREVMPKVEQYWIDIFGKVALTGESSYYENYLETTGKYYATYTYCPKKNQFAVLVNDITERKLNEIEIQKAKERAEKSEGKLNEAQRIAHLGNWELNIETNELFWSDEIYRIFDCEPHEFKATYESFLEFIHPDDREKVNSAYLKSLETKTEYQIEHRLITKKNQLKYVREKCLTTFNEQGKPLNSFGIVIDITEQKKLENELIKAKEHAEESEERFRNAIEKSPIPTAIVDNDGKVTFLNKQFVQTYGYALQEIPSTEEWFAKAYTDANYRSFVLEDWGKEVEQSIKNDVPTGYKEYLVTCKNGEVKTVSVSAYYEKDITIGLFQDITERKQAEEKIQKQNVYIKMILDNFPIGIATNEIDSTKVTYMNRKFSEIYGWPEDDFLYIGDFFEKVFPDLEYRQQLQARILADISSGDSERMKWENLKITTKAGDQRIVYAFNIPLFPENIMVSTVQDITERMQAEERLRKSEAIKDTMVSNIGDVIVIIDQNGINKYKSPNITTLFGWQPEELVGKSTWDNVHDDDLDAAKEFIATLATEPNKTKTTEIRYKRKDGRYVWIEITVANLLSDPNIRGFLGNYHDITERKLVEEELKTAKDRAEESEHLKSAFLANMSHEIRTPMNGILGFAELLKEPNLTGEQQQEYIRIIEKSGLRMLNIINDIVDISKIEANLMKVDIKDCNINDKLEFIFAFFKPQIEEKGMQLLFNYTLPAKEAIIKTDNEKIYSILTNLVKNAIKYSDEGTIELGYIKKDNSIEFYVKDTGIGIPKDRQSAIFERFIQADITDKLARQGAGLGLSISKAYVEMLGGKIWVESEEGIGSTFYFTIPYSAEPEGKNVVGEVVHEQDEKKQINPGLSGLRIIIAEDDAISEMLITIEVEKFSKNILKARTGKEVVELSRNNPDIDLIFMDIQMPEMNGYEATRQIRQFNKNVVILAQTALGLIDDREKAIEAGCNDYISKPINNDKLLSLIHRYFKK